MEIYLDVVFLLNFLVDYLLLLGTNRLSGFPPGRARCALSALLGALYGAFCLVPGFSFLGNALWRTVFLGLLGMTAFGWDRGAWKRTGIFVLLAMAMGGVALSMGKGDFPGLILAAGVVWLLCRAGFTGTVGDREYVPIQLSWGGRKLNLTALRDSGNTLRDPITSEQVLVLSADAAQALTGLTREELAHPLDTLAKRPLPGLRLIPYRAVGQTGGMLLAMRFPDVRVGKHRRSAIVAFAPEGLGEGSMYQVLTGGAL